MNDTQLRESQQAGVDGLAVLNRRSSRHFSGADDDDDLADERELIAAQEFLPVKHVAGDQKWQDLDLFDQHSPENAVDSSGDGAINGDILAPAYLPGELQIDEQPVSSEDVTEDPAASIEWASTRAHLARITSSFLNDVVGESGDDEDYEDDDEELSTEVPVTVARPTWWVHLWNATPVVVENHWQKGFPELANRAHETEDFGSSTERWDLNDDHFRVEVEVEQQVVVELEPRVEFGSEFHEAIDDGDAEVTTMARVEDTSRELAEAATSKPSPKFKGHEMPVLQRQGDVRDFIESNSGLILAAVLGVPALLVLCYCVYLHKRRSRSGNLNVSAGGRVVHRKCPATPR